LRGFEGGNVVEEAREVSGVTGVELATEPRALAEPDAAGLEAASAA